MRKWICLAAAAMVILVLAASCGKPKGAKTESPRTEAFRFGRRPRAEITFLSTQLSPVEEAGKMRNSILRDFPGQVDFRPNDDSQLFNQIDSILNADPTESILLGALHGELVKLYEDGELRPLDEVFSSLEGRTFPELTLHLSRLNGKDSYYVPWLQASFVMAANKKALPYLPSGADLGNLSYDDLARWGRNIQEKTGKRKLGFPVGEKGLMHRFIQGYLYPSFTESTLLKFRGRDARAMWAYARSLWAYAHPASLTYSTMSEPLITEDVWIAWDHTARLVKAFRERPDDFVAFPAPIGPKGRGFMAVVSGLAIPEGVADETDAAILIDYLTRPFIQERTLAETGFFPVVRQEGGEAIPPFLQSLNRAVVDQSETLNPVPTLLPIGLGEYGRNFNDLYVLTFAEIVLEGKDISSVLDANAAELQKLIDAANAKCWLPDRSEARPCVIE